MAGSVTLRFITCSTSNLFCFSWQQLADGNMQRSQECPKCLYNSLLFRLTVHFQQSVWTCEPAEITSDDAYIYIYIHMSGLWLLQQSVIDLTTHSSQLSGFGLSERHSPLAINQKQQCCSCRGIHLSLSWS
jgi:hypothetical protein